MSDEFRKVLYTVDQRGNRRWVYSSLIPGWFHNKRLIVAYLLMGFYLLMPWIEIGGQQAIFLDIGSLKFTIFGTTFWATDTTFLVLLLGFLAICLFFFTALFGRVWCGWACPETVFLEFLFRPIERLIEGNPAARRQLDQAPWSFNKLWKKGLKLLIFAFLAWILASTLLAYFIGRDRLLGMMASSPLDNPTPFILTCAVVGLVLFQFGWFREQFCTVLCPYARFQSVMMDANSLTVGYDHKRGEPRGKPSKDPNSNLGDCIDCKQCVRVCPTGIDIRNGLQLECVACAACIDACDSVMVNIGKPTGLIRYATERSLGGEPSRWLRPRVMVYASMLIIYVVIFGYRLASRPLSEAQVIRGALDRPFSYVGNDRDEISNHLTVRVSNKSDKPKAYTFEVIPNDEIKLITPITPFPVAAGQIGNAPIFIELEVEKLNHGKLPVTIIVRDGEGFETSLPVTLLGPG